MVEHLVRHDPEFAEWFVGMWERPDRWACQVAEYCEPRCISGNAVRTNGWRKSTASVMATKRTMSATTAKRTTKTTFAINLSGSVWTATRADWEDDPGIPPLRDPGSEDDPW